MNEIVNFMSKEFLSLPIWIWVMILVVIILFLPMYFFQKVVRKIIFAIIMFLVFGSAIAYLFIYVI